jgi:hypothetical protein
MKAPEQFERRARLAAVVGSEAVESTFSTRAMAERFLP